MSGLQQSLIIVGPIHGTTAHHKYRCDRQQTKWKESCYYCCRTGGIGRATAVAFADQGATVWATDINEVALGALSRERPEILTRYLDVRDSRAVVTLAEETGPIDVLFNCAGFVHDGTIFDCTEQDWDASFDLNLKSTFRMCRSFLPGMLEGGAGSIINMSSAASSVKGAPGRFVYGTTKAAVIGPTKAIAADFIGRGIRCNAICPGTVETPSLEDRIKAHGDVKVAREAFVTRQPMGRAWAIQPRSLRWRSIWH